MAISAKFLCNNMNYDVDPKKEIESVTLRGKVFTKHQALVKSIRKDQKSPLRITYTDGTTETVQR